MSFDYNGVNKLEHHAKTRLYWAGFNVFLIVLGLVLFFNDLGGWHLITYGIFIFCPISIGKNLKQYYDVKKELKRYKNQFGDSAE